MVRGLYELERKKARSTVLIQTFGRSSKEGVIRGELIHWKALGKRLKRPWEF